MAYVDFSQRVAESLRDGRVATAEDAAQFTPLELRIIELAEREDVTREIEPQSRLGRWLEGLTGRRLRRPLANPRLESLRRFASLARHHPERLTAASVAEFVAAGFSEGQAWGLRNHLAGRRARTLAHG